MNNKSFFIIFILILATTAAYLPLRHNGFINYDDLDYITNNTQVQAGLAWHSVGWALSSIEHSNWHPLTWLSHMLDVELYGLDARGHHLTNFILHLANAVLVFWILRRMTGSEWRSAVVAALFALHPVHVESVAWAAERKDVLSSFFWMLTLWAYCRYVYHPGKGRYGIVLVCFVLGLCAKPMLVTLPFALLLLDYWPLGRLNEGDLKSGCREDANLSIAEKRGSVIWRLTVEKWPLFIVTALSCVVTFISQHRGGSVMSMERIPFLARLANALNGYAMYIFKAVWPAKLAIYYPLPANPYYCAVLSGLILILISAAVVYWRKSYPYLLMGWLWFLGTLVPVIGLVQVGDQAWADRYTYIPLIGVFIMAVWGVADAAKRLRIQSGAVATATLVILGIFIGMTRQQAGYFRDSRILNEHAMAVTTRNHVACNNLGEYYFSEGRFAEALLLFKKTFEIRQDYSVYLNLILCHTQLGNVSEAMKYCREAIALDSKREEAYYELASLLAGQNRFDEAVEQLQIILSINPKYAPALNSLGTLAVQQKRYDEAAARFAEAVRGTPDYADAHYNWGQMLLDRGSTAEAVDHFEQVVRVAKRTDIDKLEAIADIFAGMGRYPQAIEAAKKGLFLSLDKQSEIARAMQGRIDRYQRMAPMR